MKKIIFVLMAVLMMGASYKYDIVDSCGVKVGTVEYPQPKTVEQIAALANDYRSKECLLTKPFPEVKSQDEEIEELKKQIAELQ